MNTGKGNADNCLDSSINDYVTPEDNSINVSEVFTGKWITIDE